MQFDDAARRTRKRFTSVQLMMLEQLFHQSSHPTREERETVAQAADMEMKSVTIWFQNKRQTERKIALHHANGQSHFPSSSPTSTSSSTHSMRPTHTRTLSTSSAHAHTHTHTHTHTTPRRKITPPRARPSLDRIASRSESRLPPPRTPTKPHDPHASLWDNMPSSPLAPPASPPARDLVEFMGGTRTLEWACAAARLAGKEGRRRHEPDRHRERDGEGGDEGDGHATAGDETEEDDIEAITPEGSLGASDVARWHGTHACTRSRPPPPAFTPSEPAAVSKLESRGTWAVSGSDPEKEALQDDDMMRAALALCGLGRRSG